MVAWIEMKRNSTVNTREFEYFMKVCEVGSITAAADELFVSRSAVSRAVTSLEDEFDCVVFERSKGGVQLTKQGELVYDMVQAIRGNFQSVKSRLYALRNAKNAATLRVGITPTNGYTVFSNFLQPVMEKGEVRLCIEEHSAFDAERLLLDNVLDVFFTPVPPSSDFFGSIDIYCNPIMIGMREGDPLKDTRSITLNDIAELPIGFLTAKAPIEKSLEAFVEQERKSTNVVIRSSDSLLLKKMTQLGFIYTISSRDTMASWDGVECRELGFLKPSVHRLLWLASSELRPELAAFIKGLDIRES